MRAVYPGTFDPVTMGHLDILARALGIFDEIEVAVAGGRHKGVRFPLDQRVSMVRSSVEEADLAGRGRVTVTGFDRLLVEYMRQSGHDVFIRGLRANSDFEYEFQMQLMNRRLAPDITGIYLMPSEDNMYLSSTLVREIAMYGGELGNLVTPSVRQALEEHYGAREGEGGRSRT